MMNLRSGRTGIAFILYKINFDCSYNYIIDTDIHNDPEYCINKFRKKQNNNILNTKNKLAPGFITAKCLCVMAVKWFNNG
jgi:hypothetical protein